MIRNRPDGNTLPCAVLISGIQGIPLGPEAMTVDRERERQVDGVKKTLRHIPPTVADPVLQRSRNLSAASRVDQ